MLQSAKLPQVPKENTMRAFALFALLLPCPALAEQILASSHVTSVTVYPQGAQVTREVVFTAAAGSHDLLITDLPAATQAELIRLASDSASLGAFSLRTDRLPPRDPLTSPDLAEAKTKVEAAEAGLRLAQAAVDAINARVEAAEAQADFLRRVKAEGGAVTTTDLQAMAEMIGTGVLAAREAALAAQTDLPAANKTLTDALTALADAQAAYDTLSQGDQDYAALSVALTTASAGENRLTVTHYIADASWQPVYDLSLTRKDTPALTVGRGVLVTQYSGEDWADIDLTLSTAQPSAQAAPSQLWPDLRRIGDKSEEVMTERYSDDAGMMAEAMAEPVAAAPMTASASAEGEVVVYHYPTAVDVADGVENLRLALDEITLTPQVEARAVPRADATAFVLASFTNSTKEILLPGQAFLMRDGTLVGSTYLPAIPAGTETEVAFGAIEGLRLTRTMPLRAEGDRGILTSSSQIEESAVLKVENLTDESWPVRLLDQVPYSEQEDLEITFSATPAPTETDVDGQRGILAWEFDLPAGETQEITLDHVLNWPEGKELQ
jgi:uncharacterized protein (TIGR02231 family)